MPHSNKVTHHTVMEPMNVIHGIYPYWKDLKVKELIQDYRKKYPDSNTSNVNAWHSTWDAHKKEEGFNPLIEVCADFLYHNLQDNAITVALVDLWCVQYSSGDYTKLHRHWPMSFSLCYYADVEEGCSPIRFSDQVEVTPENGMIIAFNGLVQHEVLPTDSHRTCVSMNWISLPQQEPIVIPRRENG